MLNYWWVTRPKRRLTSVPEILAAFSSVALAAQWTGSQNLHIAFEDELERSGLKRVGERRDHRGSGGRTYFAWLASLGLVFVQPRTGKAFLTQAGESIIDGKSPVEILKNQILKYQFPSPFSLANSSKNRVSERFKIRPFRFLLKLLRDKRVYSLSNDDIAKIIMVEAENETSSVYERVVSRINDYREKGNVVLEKDFAQKYAPCSGKVNSTNPFSHLQDVANTIMNWLEYAQLTYRDDGVMKLLPEKYVEVDTILQDVPKFIDRPEEIEYFQRKFGLDPWHIKDTRNLVNTVTVTARMIETQKIRQAFVTLSLKRPIQKISADVIEEVANQSGVDKKLTEDILYKTYPNGAISGFMTEYFEMAFRGNDDAINFEKATAELFHEVFGYTTLHLGQKGALSTPDVLLLSDADGYQAILDNKAYANYSISGDHHNRMVHNYIEKIHNYSPYSKPLAFFSYIAGGFASQIDKQIRSIVEETGVHGSGLTVSNMIKLIEKQGQTPSSHFSLRQLFSVDRQILANDV